MIRQEFFKCDNCGNMAELIKNTGIPLVCCGNKMTELIPNTAEASTEKHLPEVTMSGNSITVQVGSVPHPMDAGHHIEFIYVETGRGCQRKKLDIGTEPKLTFSFADEKPVAVYAYCNLHGLWKTEVNNYTGA